MKHSQIINIVNFIRGIEPRMEMDLVTPVKEQIRLMKELSLPGTFLIQYDALLNPTFTELLKPLCKEQFEIGIWLEIVQPQCEAAGIPWRGRYPWDWHSDVGFSVGYTPEEREKLCDEIFSRFYEVFGGYPRVMGSWAFDAHTLAYISQKWGLDAACNCKDQYGTDGYTLWGGYYGQAYYPSRKNAYCPAQTEEGSITVPVFRMLGSDPVTQYDLGLDLQTGADPIQSVSTLEPIYAGKNNGGGVPGWVDWYLSENFSGRCLSFGYAQAGQENSFGWERMKAGLTYQFNRFAELRANNQLTVEPLGTTGRRYKKEYAVTPCSTVTALSAYKDPEKKSVWFSSRFYRINLYADGGRFWIRDFHLFREEYAERYLTERCVSPNLIYDTLPITDGNRFSGQGIRAGLYPSLFEAPDGDTLAFQQFDYREDGNCAIISLTSDSGDFNVRLEENCIVFDCEKPFFLHLRQSSLVNAPECSISENTVEFLYNGFSYRIQIEGGAISHNLIRSGGHLKIYCDKF